MSRGDFVSFTFCLFTFYFRLFTSIKLPELASLWSRTTRWIASPARDLGHRS
jgi:hypothetical protein